ncbi:MAG TPA: ABC transporter permease [Pyrinomonadaceae bacterium]|nr:ABC transporter permease [Pyrinomonadaceae bacterium]
MTLLQDIRYGIRMLWKTPGFTAVALVSLALGIGVNTAVFSLFNAVLLRPVPVVREQERIVWLRAPSSYPDYQDYREQSRSFEGMAAATGTREFSFTREGGEPELLRGELVTANYFDVLGVGAGLGRTFVEDEGRTPTPVVVLSQDLWRTRFGSDPSIVGRRISLNGLGFNVVGVAPANFTGTEAGLARELWVPLSMEPVLSPPDSKQSLASRDLELLRNRNSHWLAVLARLKDGVEREQAASELEGIARRVAESNGERVTEETLRRVRLLQMNGGLDPSDREEALPIAGLVMGVVGLVLLIACANIAGLLVARAAVRRRETAIRQALGATRTRLVRQWLTESVLLGVAGGAAGLLLALWANDLMVSYAGGTPIASLDLRLDYRVLAFTLLVSVATGVVFGLAPALQASRLDIVTALKTEDTLARSGSRRSRLRAAFVTAQVTLSVVLLVCAGLFIRSLRNAHTIDPGFRVERALTVTVDLGLLRYKETEGGNFYRELLSRVESQPGVERASLVRFAQLGSSFAQGQVVAEGKSSDDGEGTGTGFNVVGPRYFETMGTSLVRGRDFTEADREGAPKVAVVNETLAAMLWPGEDALGKRLSFEGARGPFLEVVGVARDGKYRSLGDRSRPYLYTPLFQSYQPRMTLVVRTSGEPAALAGTVRGQLRALDPNLPVAEVRTLAEQFDLSLLPARVAAYTLGGFGLLALALAAIGIYGVVSYSVAQRTREIGVRVALGARARDVMRLVIGEGLSVVGLGLALGLALAFVVARLFASFLYGVGAADPLTFVGVPALLGSIALAAGYLPARRATKVDPMVALRHE